MSIDQSADPKTLKLIEKLEAEAEKQVGTSWQEAMLKMYNAGASDLEVMRAFTITPTAWKRLMSDVVSSVFPDVVEFGRIISNAWWLEQGRTNLDNRSFNSNLWNINMQNRFGWATKTEERQAYVEELVNMDTPELQKRIQELLQTTGVKK